MKDKNNTITVYSMLFSFCLEVFSKTLYLLLGKGRGVHKSGSFFHLVKLPFHLFECKQKNIFDYYLKCYDSSVCFAPWNRICFRQKFLLLSHKMAIPAQKEECSQKRLLLEQEKTAVWKLHIQTTKQQKKLNLFSRPAVCILTAKPALLLYLTPGLQLPVSLGSSDILLSKQLSFNLTVPFNQ